VVAVPASSARFTENEYLALEVVAETRHEYVGGDIIGMAGAEIEHNQIAQNVKLALGNALSGKPCRILGSDQRIRVVETGEYFYPDVVITCLEPQLVGPAPRSLLNPQVIVEVLSPTTEARDRGPKWMAYQTIPTLRDYVMLAADRRRLEHYEREQDGKWTLTVLTDGACTLSSGVKMEMPALYLLTDL
jgi:Uma2 family endonuclease